MLKNEQLVNVMVAVTATEQIPNRPRNTVFMSIIDSNRGPAALVDVRVLPPSLRKERAQELRRVPRHLLAVPALHQRAHLLPEDLAEDGT